MSRDTDLMIRALDRDNIVDLIPLYRAVFGKTTDKAYLLAKYDTSYLGPSFFGHIAYDGAGAPIAFHGAIPFRMTYRGRVELGAQYGDAMTLREHGGKGLFTLLGRRTDRLIEEAGIGLIWGFPNQNSEYGYVNKLDWQGVARMRCFDIPVPTAPFEKLSRAFGRGSRYQETIRSKLEPYIVSDGLPANSAAADDALTTVRDADFCAYKSFTNNFVIDLGGCRMWIKPEGGLLIGDIEPCAEPVILEALTELKRIARRYGITKITFQASPGTRHERLFSKHFDGFDTWLLGGKTVGSTIPLDRLRCTYGDLDTF